MSLTQIRIYYIQFNLHPSLKCFKIPRGTYTLQVLTQNRIFRLGVFQVKFGLYLTLKCFKILGGSDILQVLTQYRVNRQWVWHVPASCIKSRSTKVHKTE